MKQVIVFRQLAFVTGISSLLFGCEQKLELDNNYFGINEPIAAAITYDTISFNADSNFVLTRETGSRIIIPKESLVDKDGNLIKGNVNLSVREFYTSKDIFLSGITMQLGNTTDSILSSGGMIDIRASQNGKEIYLAKDRSARISLPSYVDVNSEYQLFKFENDSVWSEGTEFEQEKNTIKDSLILAMDSLIQRKDLSFRLKMDPLGRPHLAPWIDVEWEMITLQSELNFKRVQEIIWEYFILDPMPDSSTFRIELTSALYWNNGDERRWDAKLIARPKISSTELAKRYNQQRKIENNEAKEYAKALDKMKNFSQSYEKEKEAWIAEYERTNIERELELKKREEEYKKLQKSIEKQQDVMNSFSINSFGIYNIDCVKKFNPIAYKLIRLPDHSEVANSALFIVLINERSVIRVNTWNKIPVLGNEIEMYYVTLNGDLKGVSQKSIQKLKESVYQQGDQAVELTSVSKSMDDLPI